MFLSDLDKLKLSINTGKSLNLNSGFLRWYMGQLHIVTNFLSNKNKIKYNFTTAFFPRIVT